MKTAIRVLIGIVLTAGFAGCAPKIASEVGDARMYASTWNKNSSQKVMYYLNANRNIQTNPTNWVGWKNPDWQYEMVCGDSSYVAGKRVGSRAFYYCGDDGTTAGQTVKMKKVTLVLNNLNYQDIAIGADEEYAIGSVYALTTSLKIYFSDVWSLGNALVWRKLEIAAPTADMNADSRIDSAKSALMLSGNTRFYGAWYDISCSKYCKLFWPHIAWKDQNRWCAANYPSGSGVFIEKSSIRAKRRIETQTVDQAKTILSNLYGVNKYKPVGIPPFALPPTVQAANGLLSDDDKLPIDVMFFGRYFDTNGQYYGKLSWHIDQGSLTAVWYFKSGSAFPLSFSEFTNGAVRIAE